MPVNNSHTEITEAVHHYYWDKDLNCAGTMLTILSAVMRLPLHEQVLQSARGMHGAGGYRAQCGLVEGALLFIGVAAAGGILRDNDPGQYCFEFARDFEKEFGSLNCRDIRPGGFNDDDPPHLCEDVSGRAVIFAADFIRERLKPEAER